MAKENTKTAPAARDPWEERIPVTLPRAPKGAEQSRFVSVNDRTYQIPCGRETAVPRPVYEALLDARHAEEDLYRFIEAAAQ